MFYVGTRCHYILITRLYLERKLPLNWGIKFACFHESGKKLPFRGRPKKRFLFYFLIEKINYHIMNKIIGAL